MSALYKAYVKRPAGVTEYERITMSSQTGGKTISAYKIYAGEVFCRVKVAEASDGSVILCGTTTKFSGRNILLNHIRLQHEREYDALNTVSGKGKGGPRNAKAKNEAEKHFTEQMILINAATSKAHLSGLQQINNTMTAPDIAAAHQPVSPRKRRNQSPIEFSDDEDSYEHVPVKKPKTPTPQKKKQKKAKKSAVEVEDEVNVYGFQGDDFVGDKKETPMHRGKFNKTAMLEALGLKKSARCPACVAQQSACPPVDFAGDNWKESNWEMSACQLLANFVQPNDE